MRQLIKFKAKKSKDNATQISRNISIIFNLGERLLTSLEGKSYLLGNTDILIINPGSSYQVLSDHPLYVCFEIDSFQCSACFPHQKYYFQGNSSAEYNDNYLLLRKILSEILTVSYERKEYMAAELNRIYYELLIFLVNNFAVLDMRKETSPAERLAEYIEAHYLESLTLSQISGDFHMTPQYFSKYFKKHMGQTYYKYLRSIRMNHAVEELLSTDNTLLQVALNNGFPNADSFSSCFGQVYHMTPLEYRRQETLKRSESPEGRGEALNEAIKQLGIRQDSPSPNQHSMYVDASCSRMYTPYWKELIHVGDSRALNDGEVLSQLKELQDAFHYNYIRIQLDDSGYRPGQSYSFYQEERKLDYLLNIGFHIWFYIDFRIVEQQRLESYLDHLLSYFSNRYSIENIRSWRFELVYNTKFDPEKFRAYWACRQMLELLLKKYGCSNALLGAALSLGNGDGLGSFLKCLKAQNIRISSLTLQSEPYTIVDTAESIQIKRATDSSYIRNKILTFRQAFSYFQENIRNIYIINWSDSLLQTSPLNDSCYKGASSLKNLIDCFGEVQALALNKPLDILYTSDLQRGVLFGGAGLLSKHRIKKPIYYAYEFLNRAGSRYLAKDSHSIIFSNGNSNYQIICHNCKRLNYKYYLSEEHLDGRNLDQYFEEMEDLTLSYQLTHIKNGKYIIKYRMITADGGSVQDRLWEMAENEAVYIHPHELEYLRQICVPQIRLCQQEVTGQIMNLQLTLPANAFAYIHIIYEY
ncbi:MAG TPA: helix-turn-helix domain-containing protein [Candidatus Egerieimonas intestinavium]|uniref:Helix-turn-helix domain-containing protein n=1 Tax=Candidatus Egerieimonas intestinavium TaxID=2840777 RepID=A0A9D1EI98_9FIRM|nr:helix-turn-helix domain-containing protein [Candidatus Egerieimonas intestinavium]